MGAAQLHQVPDWKTSYQYPSVDLTMSSSPIAQDINIVNRSQGGYVGASYRGFNAMSSFTDWQTASFVQGNVGQPRWKRGFEDVSYDFNPSSRWSSTVNYTYTRNTFGTIEFPTSSATQRAVARMDEHRAPTNRDQVTVGALYTHQQGGETFYGLGFPFRSRSARATVRAGACSSITLIVNGVKASSACSEQDRQPRHQRIRAAAHLGAERRVQREGALRRGLPRAEHQRDDAGASRVVRQSIFWGKVGTFDVELAYQHDRAQGSVNFFHSRRRTASRSIPRRRLALCEPRRGHVRRRVRRQYVTKQVFLLGSILHQSNGSGVANITPIPNNSVKAGASYQGTKASPSASSTRIAALSPDISSR
jgi:hypothetical protein